MGSNEFSLIEVGARLRDERDRLGMNQTEMGEKGGVARNAQANYELGKRPADANYLLRAAEIGVDLAFVFTGERTITDLSDVERELLGVYLDLQPDDRQALLQVARSMAGRSATSRSVHSPANEYVGPPEDQD